MSPEPSVDMLRANRLRLRFNLENICSKYEKMKECGIQMSLDHPDPLKTTLFVPNSMDRREVAKNKQHFYAISENFSLTPLSARLNDDEALDFNESLRKKCEKKDKEFNECLALTPYAPNVSIDVARNTESVENKMFKLSETETIRTVTAEGVSLNELEDNVSNMHPDGDIVFRGVENNVSIIKIRYKKTVTVSGVSQMPQLRIQGMEHAVKSDFQREFRDIQRRSLTQLAIEGPVSIENTGNEDEAESVRSDGFPLSQDDGQIQEIDNASVLSENSTLYDEFKETGTESKTPPQVRKMPTINTPARKSTSNSPSTANDSKARRSAKLTQINDPTSKSLAGTRRSLRVAAQPISNPLDTPKRMTRSYKTSPLEVTESPSFETARSLSEQSSLDEQELAQNALEVDCDRQSGPLDPPSPLPADSFSAPEETPTEMPKKKKCKRGARAKMVSYRKMRKSSQKSRPKTSQPAGSVVSGPLENDDSGTVYDQVFTPAASSVQQEDAEIPTNLVSSRKRPASLLVLFSPSSKKSRQENEAIPIKIEDISSGFWQEDGKNLFGEFTKTGSFLSVLGVAKDWLPLYSPINKPLIDHWVEATVYWKENRSRDFKSGFQDFEGRQMMSAAKQRNNNIVRGFKCP